MKTLTDKLRRFREIFLYGAKLKYGLLRSILQTPSKNRTKLREPDP